MKKSLYSLVIEEIKSELRLVEQWKNVSYDTINLAGEHYSRLKALVELLEIHNCGSVGGFDKGQDRTKRWDLKDRAKYLINREE